MSFRIYAKEEGGMVPRDVVQMEDILNTVTSDATDKALSAAQGKVLFTQITDHTHDLTSNKLTGILPVNKGGTGGTTGPEALANLGYVEKINGTTLWTGTLSEGGSITIPDLSDWRLMYVRTGAPTATILIAVHGVPLRGCSGYGTANQVIISLELAVSGNVLTLTSCRNLAHNSGSGHPTIASGSVVGIYGMIKR